MVDGCRLRPQRLSLKIMPPTLPLTFTMGSLRREGVELPGKAQILLCRLSPKLPTEKVVDTNHESCGHKQWQIIKSYCFGESCQHKSSRHVEIFATKSVTSPRQTRLCRSNGIWSITMHGESQRQSQRQSSRKVFDKVADTNHENWRRDLCRGLSWFVSVTSPWLCR